MGNIRKTAHKKKDSNHKKIDPSKQGVSLITKKFKKLKLVDNDSTQNFMEVTSDVVNGASASSMNLNTEESKENAYSEIITISSLSCQKADQKKKSKEKQVGSTFRREKKVIKKSEIKNHKRNQALINRMKEEYKTETSQAVISAITGVVHPGNISLEVDMNVDLFAPHFASLNLSSIEINRENYSNVLERNPNDQPHEFIIENANNREINQSTNQNTLNSENGTISQGTTNLIVPTNRNDTRITPQVIDPLSFDCLEITSAPMYLTTFNQFGIEINSKFINYQYEEEHTYEKYERGDDDG